MSPSDLEPIGAAALSVVRPTRPYPGLRPFEESEWVIFLGRERMVDEVVGRLMARQCVVVHGDSGAGKSSLVRAGVLPRLHQEQARAGLRWRTCQIKPRGAVLQSLAQGLADLDGRSEDAQRVLQLTRALSLGPAAPKALAKLMLADTGDHMCVVLDQFEELFELGDADEARMVSDLLVNMAREPPARLYLAVTMRSEYLGNCARFPGLAEAVNACQYLLPPMSPADALRAVREPARMFHGEVDARLAEWLVADVAGHDGLPLVQHALMLMHKRKGAKLDEPWRLDAADYPKEGLGALLSEHAQEVADKQHDPELVETIFRELSQLTAKDAAIRRPRTIRQIAAVAQRVVADVIRIANAFRADGVSLMAPFGSAELKPDDTVEVSHEALLRNWRQLSQPKEGWLEQETLDGLIWRSLLLQAESYELNPLDLLSATACVERREWMERHSEVWAERYGGGWKRVEALISGSASTHRFKRNLTWILVVFTVGLLTALGIRESWNQRQRADEAQVNEARAKAQEARAKAQEEQVKLLNAALQERTAAIKVDIDTAKNATNATQVAAALTDATEKLVAFNSPAAPKESARVYVYIDNESQRSAAEAFARTLGRQALGSLALEVPPVQLQAKQTDPPGLRCFRQNECKTEAANLLAMANALLASPTLVLRDLSKTFENVSLRPHHFELWFGAPQVALKSASSSSLPSTTASAVSRIQTLVVIYAEGRSFDSLYGLFPGANGIPGLNRSAKGEVAPQRDFDGSVLPTLPPVWGGLTAGGQPVVVSQAATAGWPNQPFQIDDPRGVGASGIVLSQSVATRDQVSRFYSAQMQMGDGSNANFAAYSDAGALAMGYYDGRPMRLWKLAAEYTLADNFFAGTFGGSFLNHQYLICACIPTYPDAERSPAKNSISMLDDAEGRPPRLKRAQNNPASALAGAPRYERDGMVTPADAKGVYYAVNTAQPPYQPSAVPPAPGTDARYADPEKLSTLPPQKQPTIGTRLDARGIPWAWYAGGWKTVSSGTAEGRANIYVGKVQFQPHHQPFNFFAAFDPESGAANRARHLRDFDSEFLADAAAGALPPVTFYQPQGSFTQHAGYTNVREGDEHIADVVDRLRKSPQWPGMLIVVTYSDNGGYYDHVRVPRGDRWGPGVRIPAIIISPFAKKGAVDSTPYDTGSILRFITRRWSLEPLPGIAARDSALRGNSHASLGDLSQALVDK